MSFCGLNSTECGSLSSLTRNTQHCLLRLVTRLCDSPDFSVDTLPHSTPTLDSRQATVPASRGRSAPRTSWRCSGTWPGCGTYCYGSHHAHPHPHPHTQHTHTYTHIHIHTYTHTTYVYTPTVQVVFQATPSLAPPATTTSSDMETDDDEEWESALDTIGRVDEEVWEACNALLMTGFTLFLPTWTARLDYMVLPRVPLSTPFCCRLHRFQQCMCETTLNDCIPCCSPAASALRC